MVDGRLDSHSKEPAPVHCDCKERALGISLGHLGLAPGVKERKYSSTMHNIKNHKVKEEKKQ